MRVLVIDDHLLFAEALSPLLADSGMEVMAPVGTGAEGLETARRDLPDVVLIDLTLPDMPAVVLGRRLLEERPEVKVLAVGGEDRQDDAREVLRSGFHGFLTKDTPLPQFIRSIWAAREGKVISLPQANGNGHAPIPRSAEDRDAALLAGQLTPRELEVLEILVRGGGNGEIAERLSLRPNTVRTHVQSILTKLQVRSRLEAAAFAVRHGLVRADHERRYA